MICVIDLIDLIDYNNQGSSCGNEFLNYNYDLCDLIDLIDYNNQG